MTTAEQAGVPRLYNYSRYNPRLVEATLTINRVRFSDSARFNDPWDCAPMYVMDAVLTQECVDIIGTPTHHLSL